MRGFQSESAAVKSDLVDIEAKLIGESAAAYRIDDGERKEWVPKSLVERDGDTFTMPRWIADEKGLI